MMGDQCGDFFELEAENVVFYSTSDERLFFQWLGEMRFVEDVVGRGAIIYIKVNIPAVKDDGLMEILAFFQRYRISMRQLRVFDREEFSGWFRRSDSYWYRRVFK